MGVITEIRKAEKAKGIKAQMTLKERAKLNKEEVSNIKAPNLSEMICEKGYMPESPSMARPRTYTFKRR